VFPFLNLNADPKTEYLSDGITESTINTLSQISPKLRVMARGTVFTYKGKQVDPRKVGKDLNVDAVVTGSINQQENTLIIRADLVQVSDGTQIWGQQYNRNLSDILAVQSDISKEISEQLRLKLTGEEQKKIAKQYTENTEAYQLYLKGRYYWNKRTQDGMRKAIEYLQQATAKDPKYALAYSGLADCYIVMGDNGWLSQEELTKNAKEASTKAIALDNSLAEAHTSFASVKETEWNWREAENEYKRAIELNPNYPTAHHWYSIYLANMGHLDEAIAEARRAQELDPLSLQINKSVGDRYYDSRRYEEAHEQYRKTIEMDPNFPGGHDGLGFFFTQKGMYKEAITEFQKTRDLSADNFDYLLSSAQVYAKEGKKDEVHQLLRQIQENPEKHYVQPTAIAGIYALLKEKDQAFQWLEKAYQERSIRLMYLRTDQAYDNLRDDPRFKDLVRRVGLPQ
jgi:TolB-like protein/Tfp pilus assembly protein PilF